MTEPIIVIHWGDQEYARIAATSARNIGPSVFITDYKAIIGGVTVESVGKYSREYGFVNELYSNTQTPTLRHLNIRSISRWLIAERWMSEHHVNSALFIDSDVVLMKDPRTVWDAPLCFVRDPDVTTIWSGGASRMTYQAVKKVADGMIRSLNESKGNHPNNDMIGISEALASDEKCDWSIPFNNHVVDHNVYGTAGYKDDGCHNKLIEWDGRTPFFVTTGGQRIHACAVHCWADRKLLMSDLYERRFGYK